MKKLLGLVVLLLLLALSIQTTALASMDASQSAILKTSLQMSDEDFDSASLVIDPKEICSTSTSNNGVGGSINVISTDTLNGSDGLVIRVKNCANTDFKARWYFRITDSDGLVEGMAAPTNSGKYTLISTDGTVSEYTVIGRGYTFPALFDGVMVVEWSELSRFKYQGSDEWSTYKATTDGKLVKGSTGVTEYPNGTINAIGIYVEKGVDHSATNPVVLSSIQSYTKVGDPYSSTILGQKSYFSQTPITSTLNNIDQYAYPASLKFSYSVDDSLYTINKTEFKFGDQLIITPKQNGVYSMMIGDERLLGSDGSFRLLVTKDLTGKELVAGSSKSSNELEFNKTTKRSVVINPTSEMTGESSYSLGAGQIYSTYKLSLGGSDGIAIRVRNTASSTYYVSRIFIRTTTGYEYMFRTDTSDKTEIELIDASGMRTVQSTQRGFSFPANFDGWIVIDWSDLTTLYAGSGASATWGNTRVSNYPTDNLDCLKFTFSNRTNNADATIILDDIATYKTIDGTRTYSIYEKVLTADSTTLKATGLEVGYAPFDPITIESKSEDVTLSSLTLGYLETLVVTPKDGSAVTSVELDSQPLNKNANGTYSIRIDKDTYKELKVSTERTYAEYGDNTTILRIENATGILFSVNNQTSADIKYTLTAYSSTSTFIANRGAGLIMPKNGGAYYGDPFTIKAGFEGQIFIPFNSLRGTMYGGRQNTPWEVNPQEDLIDKFVVDYTKAEGLTNEIIQNVFSGFAVSYEEFEETSLTPSKLDQNIDGGVLIKLDEAYDNFSAAPHVKLNLTNALDFSSLGIGYYIENGSGQDMKLRIYYDTNAGTVFVPSTTYKFYMIDMDGNVTEKTVNRTIVIPSGFKGTLITPFAQMATDNISDTKGTTICNFQRQGLMVTCARFYMGAASASGIMISPSVKVYKIDSSAEIVNNAISYENAVINKGSSTVSPLIEKIESKSLAVRVVIDGKDSLLKPYELNKDNYLPYETIVVSINKDYEILSVKLSGTALTLNEDGTYSISLTSSLNDASELVIKLSSDTSAFKATFDATLPDNVSMMINSNPYEDPIKLNKNETVTLKFEVLSGYEILKVTINGEEVTVLNDEYSFTLTENTTVVVTEKLTNYVIDYVLDGGENNSGNPSSYTILDEITLKNAFKRGYRFDGWYTESTFENRTETIDSGLKAAVTLYAKFEKIDYVDSLEINEMNENAIVIDPLSSLEAETKYSQGMGYLYSTNGFSLASTDGIAIRIRNLSTSSHFISRIMIVAENNYVYMPSTDDLCTYVFIDNSGERIATSKTRGLSVPASFDGWVLISWSDMTALNNGNTTDVWTNTRLTRSTYPTENFKGLRFTFDKRADNAECKIIIGEFATFVLENDKPMFEYQGYALTTKNNTLSTENLEVYTLPTFTINISNNNPNVTLNKTALKFGDTLVVTPKETYSITSCLIGSKALNKNVDGTFSIIIDEDFGSLLDTTTVQDDFEIEYGTSSIISIDGKTGVLFKVKNTTAYDIDYKLILTDTNGERYTAYRAAGLVILLDGTSYYTDVFTIKQGMEAEIFIPFNTYRGSTYGEYQNIPFDSDIAESLNGIFIIKYEYIEGLPKEDIAKVFNDFSVESKTYAESQYIPGKFESTVEGGISYVMPSDYDNFSAAPSIRVSVPEGINFNQKTISFYVENNSNGDAKLRIYFLLTNGQVYVPTLRYQATLIGNDGKANKTTVGRTIIIPKDFQGTLAYSLTENATDNVSGDTYTNMDRFGTFIKEIRFYVGGGKESGLSISKDIKTYDIYGSETLVENALLIENAKVNAANSFEPKAMGNVKALPNVSIRLDGEEIADNSIYSFDNEGYMPYEPFKINLTDKYSVLSITIDGIELTKEGFNEYSATIYDVSNTVINVELSSEIKFDLTANFDSTYVSIMLNGVAYEGTTKILKDSSLELTLKFSSGYEVERLLVNGKEVTIKDDKYTITVQSDLNIEVVHKTVTYTINYNLDGGTNNPNNIDSYTVLDAFSFSSPVKEGYKFVGWYKESAFENEIIRITKGSSGNLDLFAKFEKIQSGSQEEPTQEKKGCFGEITLSVLGSMSLLFVALIAKKREEE